VCSPFRAVHEWRQAALAREGGVVDSDGSPPEHWQPEHWQPEHWQPDHATRRELVTPRNEEQLRCTSPTATT